MMFVYKIICNLFFLACLVSLNFIFGVTRGIDGDDFEQTS